MSSIAGPIRMSIFAVTAVRVRICSTLRAVCARRVLTRVVVTAATRMTTPRRCTNSANWYTGPPSEDGLGGGPASWPIGLPRHGAVGTGAGGARGCGRCRAGSGVEAGGRRSGRVVDSWFGVRVGHADFALHAVWVAEE